MVEQPTLSPPATAVVLMDRFVSASSAQDAVESLQGMVDGLKDVEEPWNKQWILQNVELVDHLTFMLRHGTLKNDSPCGEDGVNLVCQLYQKSLASHPDALQQPAPGQLLEALLDVMDNPERQIYTRVLALQVLEQLAQNYPNVARTQWLQAPNGLHRLADLLSLGSDNPMEEVVRNQALLVARILAREASISKVFLFAEVECKLLDLCWQQGGLTKGSSFVLDALNLIQEMLKHADAALQDLVWQRPSVSSRLAQLIDLRGADEFLHPENYRHKVKNRKMKASKKTKKEDDNDDDDDDLDSLLQSGTNTTKSVASKTSDEKIDVYIPRLSDDEEMIVDNVLHILGLLLESESLRPSVWIQHAGMCSLVWELALVNPANPPVCGIPSASLQQKALELVAIKFNDPTTMERHAGLDRLLYLVCTGGGNAQTYFEKIGLSQAALAVLRQTLDRERIHGLLLHTLAPPPEEEGVPPGPTIVQKLWNTVVENLSIDITAENKETRRIFLSGALGGLALMLHDEQSREMMTRVVPDEVNADIMLEALQTEKDAVVQWSLLRFLCEWIMETPLMVQKLLKSTASTNLATMAAAFDKDYIPLVHLLLGLSMQFLPSDEQDCGGWTRSGILQMIQNVGLSKYTNSLEGFKTVKIADMPCSICDSEYNHWVKWYKHAVWIVRKRIVQELAGGNTIDDDSEGEDGERAGIDGQTSTAGIKPLRKLLSKQSTEIDALREEMEHANMKLKSQEHQLDIWQRRMESNPTELDSLLSEMTSKNAGLVETISKLESDAKSVHSGHEKELSSLNSQLAEVREEASELRRMEKEARDERERMEQELSALSQAYASLEEEYQRERKSNKSSTVAGDRTGEDIQQSQPELPEQKTETGSTEVATLRAENTRLKDNARAADDWMKMAVTRMNDMGQHSNILEQQVTTLTNEIKVLQDQGATKEQEQEKHFRVIQDRKESEWKEKLSNLESRLQEERTLRESIEANASNTTADLQSELDNEKKHLAELQIHLAKAQERLGVAIKEKEEMAHNLEAEKSQEDPIDGSNHISNEKIESLRNEFERKKSHLEEEVYKKESIIRELEDRLNSGLGEIKVEDIHARDEEIEELRTANEAAQEWMAKAVDHHQSLSTQVATLTKEKASLVAKVDELEQEMPQANNSDASIELLKEELVEKSNIIDSIKRDLAKTEDEVAKLQQYREQSMSMKQEIEIARDDMARLQTKYEESLEASKEQELAESIPEDEKQGLKAENDLLQERLDQFQSWADVAQQKISELVSAKEDADDRVADLEAQITSLNSQLKDQEEDANKAIAQWQESYSETENRCLELEKTLVMVQEEAKTSGGRNYEVMEFDRSDRVAELESQIFSLNSQLQDQKEDATKAIAQWQESYSESENRCDELEKALAMLQEEAKTSQGPIHEQIDYDNDDRTVELQSQISSLKSQMQDQEEDAKKAIVQWQQSYSESEKRCSGLEKTLEVLQKENTTLEEAIQNAQIEPNEALQSDEALKLETQITSLNAQLKEQEEDAKKAIAQWQESYSETNNMYQELEKTVGMLREEKEDLKKALQDAKDEQGNDQESKVTPSLDDTGAPEARDESELIMQLQKQLEAANDTIAQDEDVVHQWEVRVSELEANVQSLEMQLADQEREANDVISQWQESYSTADDKCKELSSELHAAKLDMESLLSSEEKIKGLKAKLDEAIKNEAVLRGKNESMQKEKEILSEQIASIQESLSEKEIQAEQERKDLNDKLKLIERDNARLENERLSLGERLKAFEEENLSESLTHTLQQLQAKEEELIEAREALTNDEEVLKQWEERVNELQAIVEDLESQLQDHEAEAHTVISSWQERLAEVEEDNDVEMKKLENEVIDYKRRIQDLEGSLADDSLKTALEESRAIAVEFKQKLASEQDERNIQVGALAKEIEGLRSELADTRKEAKTLQLELENEKQRYQEAQEEVEVLDRSLDEIKIESEGNSEELKSIIKQLKVELQDQETNTSNIINEWMSKASELEANLFDLKQDLSLKNEQVSSSQIEIDSKKAELAETKETSLLLEKQLAAEQAEARDQIEVLEKALEEMREESEEVVHQWTERVEELESLVTDLERQIQQHEEEANEAISIWESKTLDFERDLDATTEASNALKEERDSLKIKVEMLEVELEGTKKLEEERDRLTVVVTQLEDEVREANDMLQAYITDETAERATGITANALRDEIQDLNVEIDQYKQHIENERMAREVAELEIESLKDDIATLTAFTTLENMDNKIQLSSVDAAEMLRRKGRVEMEEMRRSLYRAVDELEVSQAVERETLENLSKVQLHTSVCEQEIVAAKSEIHFLSQALEELRLTEESKRASLEYRIVSLEDENEVLIKYHASELEDMRHELSTVTMEKDRILYELREMEKTNDALVLAASIRVVEDVDRIDDYEAEAAKLRVENAHLLTVAADDKVRAERKLKELLAAQAASTEADYILEHELRVAAEETITRLRMELDQIKHKINQESGMSLASSSEKLVSLNEELVKVKHENTNLKKEMEKEAFAAKASMDALNEECRRLTEECRMAQSKAHKAERDGRYDAAVKSEVARIRMSPNPEMRDDTSILKLGSEPIAVMESPSKNVAALDLIQRQKEEIQEERKMYLEFLAEHDDLLALLAQLDVERMCLRDVLSEVGGEDAVTEAMQKAEDRTVHQFGKILEVTQSP